MNARFRAPIKSGICNKSAAVQRFSKRELRFQVCVLCSIHNAT